ncbi:hypothetical protein DV738_g241, partial [Chaetothyriales sp. CBS 135597]
MRSADSARVGKEPPGTDIEHWKSWIRSYPVSVAKGEFHAHDRDTTADIRPKVCDLPEEGTRPNTALEGTEKMTVHPTQAAEEEKTPVPADASPTGSNLRESLILQQSPQTYTPFASPPHSPRLYYENPQPDPFHYMYPFQANPVPAFPSSFYPIQHQLPPPISSPWQVPGQETPFTTAPHLVPDINRVPEYYQVSKGQTWPQNVVATQTEEQQREEIVRLRLEIDAKKEAYEGIIEKLIAENYKYKSELEEKDSLIVALNESLSQKQTDRTESESAKENILEAKERDEHVSEEHKQAARKAQMELASLITKHSQQNKDFEACRATVEILKEKLSSREYELESLRQDLDSQLVTRDSQQQEIQSLQENHDRNLQDLVAEHQVHVFKAAEEHRRQMAELREELESWKVRHQEWQTEKVRLYKVLGTLGHAPEDQEKGQTNEFYAEGFKHLADAVEMIAAACSHKPPRSLPVVPCLQLEPGVPDVFGSTQAACELRALVIQHRIYQVMHSLIFQRYVFGSLDGCVDEDLDRILSGLSALIGQKSVRREALWRSIVLRALQKNAQAKAASRAVASTAFREIVEQTQGLTDIGYSGALADALKQTVKTAVEIWRQARVETDPIVASSMSETTVLPHVGGEVILWVRPRIAREQIGKITDWGRDNGGAGLGKVQVLLEEVSLRKDSPVVHLRHSPSGQHRKEAAKGTTNPSRSRPLSERVFTSGDGCLVCFDIVTSADQPTEPLSTAPFLAYYFAQQPDFTTKTYPSQASLSPGDVSHSSEKQNIGITSNPTPEHGPVHFGSTANAYGSNLGLDAGILTPDYSDSFYSAHATPQELIWTREFISHEPLTLDMPDVTGRGRTPDMSSTRLDAISPPSTYNYTLSGRDEDLPQYISEALRLSQTGGYLASPSPIVIVSTHNQGDSPAQSVAPRARSSSKRRLESSSIQETHATSYVTEDDYFSDHSLSHLMPPLPFETDSYAPSGDDRAGLSPANRGNELVTSINQLAEQRGLDERNAGIQEWLSKSETGSVAGDDPNELGPHRVRRIDRPRAYTTGTRPNPIWLPTYSDHRIPGPGLLLDEPSDDGYSYDDSTSIPGSEPVPESPPVSQTELSRLDAFASERSSFPAFDDSLPPEMQEPLQSQFLRRTPWQDPLQGPIIDQQTQPQSSNAAVWKFNLEAANWESASRAATWGTRRRLTDNEINAIVDGSRVRHLSLVKCSSNIFTKARGLIPRRSNSNIKKAPPSPSADSDSMQPEPIANRDPASPRRTSQRMPSLNKPKSPPLNTGSAIMAMTGNLAAIGSSHGGHFTLEPEKLDGFRNPFNVLRKHRSKSDVSKSSTKGSPALGGLMLSHGGTPMPKLASPLQEHSQLLPQKAVNEGPLDYEDDDVGISMDLSIRADNIIPTFEGFKAHIQELNPRLEPFLVDRFAQEQVRRYKKLLENKVKHTHATKVLQKCSSESHCISLGGVDTLLQPHLSAKDNGAQFQASSPVDGELDESSLEEGVAVTPAQFPPGIPLPPVSRLPAEFECFLCYKVKKLQKPSDWTKHVHEDVQPFTCTFPSCNEVKSFKRKADWVRHESERHRRLEYWECSVLDCSHVCYRKDNFVQHLVREHKKTEPKTKSRGSGSSKAQPNTPNPGQMSADEALWRLVDSCRHESVRKPQEEPCRFCGNVCNSWKKLSVHLAKHLEQIAMPVLQLVSNKEVDPDFAISPIEQKYSAATATTPASQAVYSTDAQGISPHGLSTSSRYRSRSTGQSPSVLLPLMPTHAFDQVYRSPNLHPFYQSDMVQGANFGNGTWYADVSNGNYDPSNGNYDPSNGTTAPSNGTYAPSNIASTNMCVSTNPQLGSFPTSLQPSVFPNTVPVSQQDSQPMPSFAKTETSYPLSNISTFVQASPTQLGPDPFGLSSYERQPALFQTNLSISHTTGGFVPLLGPSTEADNTDSAALEMLPGSDLDHRTATLHPRIPSFASSFDLGGYADGPGLQNSSSAAKPWSHLVATSGVPAVSDKLTARAPADHSTFVGTTKDQSRSLKDSGLGTEDWSQNDDTQSRWSQLPTQINTQIPSDYLVLPPQYDLDGVTFLDRDYYQTASQTGLAPDPPTQPQKGIGQTQPRKSNRPSTRTKEQLKCDRCGKVVKTPSEMKKHIANHERPFVCEEPGCENSKGFPTRNDLDRHQKSVHQTPTGSRYYKCFAPGCPKREKNWPRRDNFTQHLKRLHKNESLEELIKRSDEWYDREHTKEAAKSDASLHSREVEDLSEAPPPVSRVTHSIAQGQLSLRRNQPRTVADPQDLAELRDKQTELAYSLGPSFSQSHPEYDLPQSDLFAQIGASNDPFLDGSGLMDALPPTSTVPVSSHAVDSRANPDSGLGLGPLLDFLDTYAANPSAFGHLRLDEKYQQLLKKVLEVFSGSNSSMATGGESSLHLHSSTAEESGPQKGTKCPICAKVKKLPSELKKHLKRHSRPYGCVLDGCFKRFGSKNDWKRHEGTHPTQAQCFRCDGGHSCPESGMPCKKALYGGKADYCQHLLDCQVSPDQVNEIAERRLINDSYQRNFWCGFCDDIVRHDLGGPEALTRRHNHIDRHFQENGLRTDDWIELDGEGKKKQEIQQLQNEIKAQQQQEQGITLNRPRLDASGMHNMSRDSTSSLSFSLTNIQ